MTDIESNYWRRKLNAYMHDNPEKATGIQFHEWNALRYRLADQFTSEDYYDKQADFGAAAADRLPFPIAKKMRARFDGKDASFRHPLGGGEKSRSDERTGLPLPLDKPIQSAEEAHESANDTRVILDEGDARSQFICRWRFWRHWACEREPAFAYFPADTRIPDHTIWNHLSVTTAMQGCLDRDPDKRAALLLFSLGPVQPLIAAARSFRDLWSGSYLLSYLLATALGEIAKELGPDHILFPSAWGQPLLDLMLREVYQQSHICSTETDCLWDLLWRDDPEQRQRYLLPSLPNRFLALVPASEADDWGKRAERTIREKLQQVGESVIKQADVKISAFQNHDNEPKGEHSLFDWYPDRLKAQLDRSLDFTWQTLPVPKSFKDTLDCARSLLPPEASQGGEDKPPSHHPAIQSLDRLQAMWQALPAEHRTSYGLDKGACAWPALHALVSWLHDGAKQARLFEGWDSGPENDQRRRNNKDYLTGKEEYILAIPNDKGTCRKLSQQLSGGNQNLFKPNETLGALSLVKRLWHLSWLSGESDYGFVAQKDFRMPNLHQLARSSPQDSDEDDEVDDEQGGYFAILALDGDEMGKWVSGSKMPQVCHQLAAEALQYFEKEATKDTAIKAFLDGQRPLNPSFHLQFSEMLANFGLYAARRIVESFDGRLIYAGGDDVLAVLPGKQALACARALRAAFRGEPEALAKLKGVWRVQKDKLDLPIFKTDATRPGAFQIHPDLHTWGFALHTDPKGYDLLVPGPATDCSAGIAVAHYKSPLQDVVRAAQEAEKRAKKQQGRAAVAVTLLKRSGEIIEWGCQWESGGLELYRSLSHYMDEETLSGGFPYRVTELLSPYLNDPAEAGYATAEHYEGFNASEIIEREFAFALQQQCARPPAITEEDRKKLIQDNQAFLQSFLKKVSATLDNTDEAQATRRAQPGSPHAKHSDNLLRSVIGLCQTLAFIRRQNV